VVGQRKRGKKILPQLQLGRSELEVPVSGCCHDSLTDSQGGIAVAVFVCNGLGKAAKLTLAIREGSNTSFERKRRDLGGFGGHVVAMD
jgi:hypothetical protein